MSTPASAPASASDPQPRNAGKSLQHLIYSASIFFALGFAMLMAQLGFGAGFRMVLWGLAFAMCGIVLGFLFGIPRDDTKTVNNNLVEISDWLTKIIVGVGLTELRSIPRHIATLANFIAGTNPDSGGPTIAAATMLYFSALGFFHGYLLTRLVLQILFAETSQEIDGLTQAIAPEMKNLSIAPEAKPDEKVAADPQVKELAAAPLDSLKTPEQIATWAKANLTLGQHARAVEGYRLATDKLPHDARIAAEYGMALYRQGAGVETAFAQLLKARDLLTTTPDPRVRRDLYRWLTYVSLYRQPPQGYSDTIKFADEYSARADAEPSASLLINKACAYGQKYNDEKKAGADDETLGATKAAALQTLQAALKINSDYRAQIGRLLNGEIPGDNDLVVFKDDPAFKQLIAG